MVSLEVAATELLGENGSRKRPRTNQKSNEVEKYLRDLLQAQNKYTTIPGHRKRWKELACDLHAQGLISSIAHIDFLAWMVDNKDNKGPKELPLPFEVGEQLCVHQNTLLAASLELPNTLMPLAYSDESLPQTPLLISPFNPSPSLLQSADSFPLQSPDHTPGPHFVPLDNSSTENFQQNSYHHQSNNNLHYDSPEPVHRLHVDDLTAYKIRCNDVLVYCDRRRKENIRDLEPHRAVEILSRIKAKIFNYKREFGGDGRDVCAFIAQELQEACPGLVAEVEPNVLAVRHNEIIPLLVEAINEMHSTFSQQLGLIDLMASKLHIKQEPMPLATIANGKLVINQAALDVLSAIQAPVSVLGVCGTARSGNSSLCNLLIPDNTEACFKTGNGISYCTTGVWMSPPIKQANGSYRIELDAQAYDWGDHVLEHIAVIVEVKKILHNINKYDLPALIILIRDAQLEHFTIAGHKATPEQYLEDILNNGPASLKPTREAIQSFPVRTLMELPRRESEHFPRQLELLRKALAGQCIPKRLGDQVVDGKMLAELARTGADALSRTAMGVHVPTLAQKLRCRAAVDRVWKTFQETMDGQSTKIDSKPYIDDFESATSNIPLETKKIYLEELQGNIKMSELKRFADDLQFKYEKMLADCN